MSRRVSLPGADELFGGTDSKSQPDSVRHAEHDRSDEQSPQQSGRSSGRVRHEEKITVYVTADELLELEDTRLAMRRNHGVAVDRGRIVREAIRLALDGIAADGDESALVRRLRES